ncbi:MAG TPA: OmpW family outer membrane protein [Ferruginibacter sp.]|nr:OmpW family outer membrane protein [Ferruginibacter sp.]
MKKMLLFAAVLLITFAATAQDKKTTKENKWKARARVIAAIPPSNNYDLSATSHVSISTAVVPELDFTYFFTKNLAAELILGTTHHTVKSKSTTSTDLGKVWLLPPTLNLQYHFNQPKFDPYVGVGINYTIFYGVSDNAAPLAYKNNVGFSTQLGMDYNLNDKWFLNLDIKKIFLKTDVSIKGTTTFLSGVKVDPFVIGLGAGLRF